MKKLDELALITRCVLADDRQAFGMLVEAYQPRVRRFFLNLTLGDAALSDDLAQETFIKAYLNLRTFKGMAGFGTWLYRIGYNEFYTHTRHRREDRIEGELPADALGVTASADETWDVALTVREALSRLGDEERTAVTLFYMEDMPVKRVAGIMRLPEGTVKSHLHRAKKHLAQFLKND